ncbi:MAG: hybrid sensor histidine kinase/response regulator [Cyanobacteria bacterium P01_D01_bin.44]
MLRPSILIIDDEPDNFDVIETILSPQDYQLHYAAGGRDAISSLDTFQPDLILLDVMMPELDGIEVCRQIKAMPQWQTVPIIMVTALNDKSDLAQCLTTGADDFISKPVNAVELRARAHSMLRIKQQYDSIQTLSRVQQNTIGVLESTLSELRGSIASKLAHELNTPLNGIFGMIELLKHSLEDIETAEALEILGWAEQSARRLENLTKKFLVYLELEQLSANGPPPVNFTPSQFCNLTIVDPLKAHAKKFHRSQDLIFQIENAEVSVSGDYLSIIVHELVDNALKFSPPSTPVKISSQIEKSLLKVSVHDSGRGMTANQIAKVAAFMQFEREIHEQQGIGMGLKLVKKIVELAGGEFSIVSTYNQCTTVNLTLPIVDS